MSFVSGVPPTVRLVISVISRPVGVSTIVNTLSSESALSKAGNVVVISKVSVSPRFTNLLLVSLTFCSFVSSYQEDFAVTSAFLACSVAAVSS